MKRDPLIAFYAIIQLIAAVMVVVAVVLVNAHGLMFALPLLVLSVVAFSAITYGSYLIFVEMRR
jgi:hypothetical protein